MDIERKNCTLPLESPVSTPSDTCQRAPKPSKILTRYCVPSRADYSRIFHILSSLIINSHKSMNADIRRFHRISRQTTIKTAGNACQIPFSELKNIGLLGHKHPYFPCQTSELYGKEVRCFLSPQASESTPIICCTDVFPPNSTNSGPMTGMTLPLTICSKSTFQFSSTLSFFLIRRFLFIVCIILQIFSPMHQVI